MIDAYYHEKEKPNAQGKNTNCFFAQSGCPLISQVRLTRAIIMAQ
jgi:hypothetical protein